MGMVCFWAGNERERQGYFEMTSARIGDAPTSEYSPVIIQWLECAQSLGSLRLLRFMSLQLFAFRAISVNLWIWRKHVNVISHDLISPLLAVSCSQCFWSAMAGHDRPTCYTPPQDVWTHLRSFSCCSNFRTLLSSRQVSFCVWLRRPQMFQPVPACSKILRRLRVKFFRVDLNNWKILQEHVHLHCLYLLLEIMTNTCFDRFSPIAMEPSFLTMSCMARVSVLCSCFHVLWRNVRKQHSTHAWWFCYCVNTFISISRGNLHESPGLTVMFCANFISLQSREWRNLEVKCKTWSCLSMLKPFEKFEGFRMVLECEDLPLFSAIEARAAICGSAYSVLVVCSIATRGSFAESSCYSLWKSIIALNSVVYACAVWYTKTFANLRVCTFRNLTTGAIQATRLGESAKGNHQISPVFSGTEQILVNWGSFWVS